MEDITAIIITLNEEKNIERCIESIKKLVKRIIVVDSGSVDGTVSIAKKLGADVYYNKFINHSKQFNWGLDNCQVNTKWVLRLDADECFNKELNNEIKEILNKKETNVSGYIISFDTFFLNKKLRFGGVNSFKKLILFKNGVGRVEDREMDERVIVEEGIVKTLRCKAQHHDFKNIESFVKRHIWYAKKEVKLYQEGTENNNKKVLGNKSISSNRSKRKLYYRFPMFLRCSILFFIRFIVKLGFLDGKRGLIYHFISTYFYRYMVDSFLYENTILNEKN